MAQRVKALATKAEDEFDAWKPRGERENPPPLVVLWSLHAYHSPHICTYKYTHSTLLYCVYTCVLCACMCFIWYMYIYMLCVGYMYICVCFMCVIYVHMYVVHVYMCLVYKHIWVCVYICAVCVLYIHMSCICVLDMCGTRVLCVVYVCMCFCV